jgi:hypothetical protein
LPGILSVETCFSSCRNRPSGFHPALHRPSIGAIDDDPTRLEAVAGPIFWSN